MSKLNWLKRKLQLDRDPPMIAPYGGYLNDDMLFARARVLDDEGIRPSADDSLLDSLRHSFRRFESDEIAGAPVRVGWGEHQTLLHTDSEGYLRIESTHRTADFARDHSQTTWWPLSLQLIDDRNEVLGSVEMDVMKPGTMAQFGVISDMDDTVIQTGVSSFLKLELVKNSLFRRSDERLPLEGVSDFYNLLHQGGDGRRDNPFFYLSNSPWNIHRYLRHFLDRHDLPRGVLLLRDFGLHLLNSKPFEDENKFRRAAHIMRTYPKLPFILIGDAAEIDAEIYLELARRFEGQVQVIYIKAVASVRRTERVARLIENRTDVEVKLIADSYEAIEHARRQGWIAPAASATRSAR